MSLKSAPNHRINDAAQRSLAYRLPRSSRQRGVRDLPIQAKLVRLKFAARKPLAVLATVHVGGGDSQWADFLSWRNLRTAGKA